MSGSTYGNGEYIATSPYPLANADRGPVHAIDNGGGSFSNFDTYPISPDMEVTWTGPSSEYIIDGKLTTLSGSTFAFKTLKRIRATSMRMFLGGAKPSRHILLGTNDGKHYTTLYNAIDPDPLPNGFKTYEWVNTSKWFDTFMYIAPTAAPQPIANGVRLLVIHFKINGFEIDPESSYTIDREYTMCIKPSPTRRRYF
jgi:hypothetical protein